MLDLRPGMNGNGFAIWFLWSSKLQLSIGARKWRYLLARLSLPPNPRFTEKKTLYVADSHNPFESLGCTIWSRIYFVAHSEAFPAYTICTRDGNLQRQLLFGEKLRTETLSSLSFCGEPEEKVLTSSDRTSFNETESTTEISQLMLFPRRPRQALHRNFARSQSLGWRIVGKLLSHSPSDNAENRQEIPWNWADAIWYLCALNVFSVIAIEKAFQGAVVSLNEPFVR